MEMKGREGRGMMDKKSKYKSMKILKVLSVLVIVIAQGCEEGEWDGEGGGGASEG